MSAIFPPIAYFTDSEGNPLDNGMIFIGAAGQDAVENPIAVYWDSAQTIPAEQPIRTSMGFPVYQGTPSTFYIASSASTTTVKDRNGNPIYTNKPTSTFADFLDGGALYDLGFNLETEGAVGNGSTDDRAAFAAVTADQIFLLPGKTYYIGSSITITQKVISLGGKLKRAAAAVVTLAGGLEGPLDIQVFDVSNITPVIDVQIDATDDENIYKPGAGSFTVYGRCYLRWFISDIGLADQSLAFLHLAYTGENCEKWIGTSCGFTLAHVGNDTVIPEGVTITQKQALKTYARTAGDPELNYFGETGRFGIIPINNLDLLHMYGGGEIDCNASNSFDVADDFKAYRPGTSGGVVVTGAANNGSGRIRITAPGHGYSTNNRVYVYGVGGTVEANGRWKVTVIDANTFDLNGSTFTNAYTSGGDTIGQVLQNRTSANGIFAAASGAVLLFAGDTGYSDDAAITQAATSATGIILDETYDPLTNISTIQIYVTSGTFDASEVVSGGTPLTPTAVVYNGDYVAPRKVVIEDLHIHNVIRNGIGGNNGADDFNIIRCKVGNCYVDHWVYCSNNKRLNIRQLAVYGFAANGGMQISTGHVEIGVDTVLGLAQNPITARDTLRFVQVRSTTGLETTIVPRISGDFSLMSSLANDCHMFFSSGAGKINVVGGYVEYTGSSTTLNFAIYGQSNGGNTSGLSFIGTQFRGMPLARLIQIPVSNLTHLNISGGVKWGYLSAVSTSTAGALIEIGGNLLRARVLDFFTDGSSTGVGWKQLAIIGGNMENCLFDGLDCVTFGNDAQLMTVTGTGTDNLVRDGRARVLIPDATMLSKCRFDNFAYGNTSSNVFRPRALTTTVGALPGAPASGSGARATVTDANATTFASIVAAGGANTVPVFSDGTNWRIG